MDERSSYIGLSVDGPTVGVAVVWPVRHFAPVACQGLPHVYEWHARIAELHTFPSAAPCHGLIDWIRSSRGDCRTPLGATGAGVTLFIDGSCDYVRGPILVRSLAEDPYIRRTCVLRPFAVAERGDQQFALRSGWAYVQRRELITCMLHELEAGRVTIDATQRPNVLALQRQLAALRIRPLQEDESPTGEVMVRACMAPVWALRSRAPVGRQRIA